MINVSDFTKKVYSEYNVPKYLTVSFPNDNIPDITNENIYSESMKLTQSICEENTLQVGGCNAAQFEMTVLDVEQDLSGKDIVVNISVKDPHYKRTYVNGRAYKENDVVIQSGNYYSFLIPWGSDLSISSWIRTTSGSTVVFTSDSINNSGNGTRIYFENNAFDDITIQLLETIVPPQIEDEVLVVHENQSSFSNDVIEYSNAPLVNDDILEFPTIIRTNNVEASFEDNYVVENIEDDVESYQIRISSQLEDESNALHSRICLTDRFDSVNNYREHNFGYIDTSLTDDIVLFRGKIVSANRQKDKRLKDIIAYDKLFEIKDIDVSEWLENQGYIDHNYQRDWKRGVFYKTGDIVRYVHGTTEEYWKCIGNNINVTVPPSSMSTYDWEYIYDETAEIVSVGLGNLINQMLAYLGITLSITEVPLPPIPLDDYNSVIHLEDRIYTAYELLEEFFNNNSLMAYINPTTGNLDCRNLNRTFDGDSNYCGKWISYAMYSPDDIVSYKEDGESISSYYKAIEETINEIPTESSSWEKMPDIYSPNRRINYSKLYDFDDINYQDYDYICSGRSLVDEAGNVIKGSANMSNVLIKKGVLKGIKTDDSIYWQIVNPLSPTFHIEYTPTQLKAVGLPFVLPGDWITYDVEEYEPDTDTMVVKTKNTVILKRVLSGINMLTDEIESRYE